MHNKFPPLISQQGDNFHQSNPKNTGTYTVTVTATDSGRTSGNTATAIVTIVAEEKVIHKSEGGCNLGFGFILLGLVAVKLLRKR